MDKIIIREAKTEDAKEIISYLNQIGGESDNLLFGFNEFNMSVENEMAYIRRINDSNKDWMLIALIDDEIAGIASLQGFSQIRIEHRCNLAVSVKKKYWHQGIGTQLIKKLIVCAKEREIDVIDQIILMQSVCMKNQDLKRLVIIKSFLKSMENIMMLI